jgi:LPXTG-motif cell wall-anchored protein
MYLHDRAPKPLGGWLDIVGDVLGNIFGGNKSSSNDDAILLMLQQQQQQQLAQQQQAQQTKWLMIAGVGAALIFGGVYFSKKR